MVGVNNRLVRPVSGKAISGLPNAGGVVWSLEQDITDRVISAELA